MSVLKMSINQNSHMAKNSNLSRKVDKKLEYVADMLAYSAGNRFKDIERHLFWKRVLVQGFHYITFIDLKYNYENRAVAISYNLELSSVIDTNEKFQECGDCHFEVVSKGRLNVKNAEWTCTEYYGSEEEKSRFLERLNNNLILERIQALDLHKIRASHKKDSGKWQLQWESMVGSSTWVLIPPLISLIKPKQEDCVKIMEFFELVSDALVNNK